MALSVKRRLATATVADAVIIQQLLNTASSVDVVADYDETTTPVVSAAVAVAGLLLLYFSVAQRQMAVSAYFTSNIFYQCRYCL